jgi:hypothetical protein
MIGPGGDLAAESGAAGERRQELLAEGVPARAAAFTTRDAGVDAAKMAAELDCDLLLVDAAAGLLDNPVLRTILATAPCDVAVLIGAVSASGPLLVPFVGAAHDWTAIELAAWVADSWKVPLRLAGPVLEERDSSRLLASASLAIQHALGVSAEPLLLPQGPDGLARASRDAALVIFGLSDRWERDGLGTTRVALTELEGTPARLVRRGLRPGGLAPPASLTRYTWSLGPSPG